MVTRVCVVTATRAEFGLLSTVIKGIINSPSLELQLIVAGTHLLPEYGKTINEIEAEGFYVDASIEMIVAGDSITSVAKSLGLTILGVTDAFARLRPDVIVVLGDRYEMLGVASVAAIMGIPICHLYGGELTQGAIDDMMRHAITKLSKVHCTSSEAYSERVVQLGEPPEFVVTVGALGLDNVRQLTLLDREQILNSLDLPENSSYFLVTYHPATADSADWLLEVDNLVQGLISSSEHMIVVTLANADVGGQAINARFEHWRTIYPNRIRLFPSLGYLRYLSAAKGSVAVVGNSSSGIIEVPSLGVPTINIGPRQLGRIQADSIINCEPSLEGILAAVNQSFAMNSAGVNVVNPYGDGYASERIISVLESTPWRELSPAKVFHDLRC